MLLPWLAVFDFLSIRTNFKKTIDLYEVKKRSNDFALLVPIFNDVKYLGNVAFLRKYAKHVILCSTDQETPEFRVALEKIACENGFRISYAPVEGKGKNPWAIYSKTLLAHDAVLKVTTYKIKEKYVIFIDADTYVDGDLTVLCGAMEENNFELASVRVLPSRRETIMERLQGIEYDIAMRGRLLYPWLTSGAGMIAKSDVMNAVLENHSLFFNGGDIEIGKLADMMGFRVGHVPMVFYTDVPPTFVRWMNQRKSWMCGKFRHSIINIHHNLHYPFHFLYFSLILYFLYPFKVLEAISHPQLLPIIIAFYAITTYLANWKVRTKWMLIYPLYAFFQVMIGIWQGVWRYTMTVRRTGNYGKIRIVSNPKNLKCDDPHRLPKRFVNLTIILLTTFLILFGTIEPIQWLFMRRIYPLTSMLADGLVQLQALTTQSQPLLQHGINQINHFTAQNTQLVSYAAIATIIFFGNIMGHAYRIHHVPSRMLNRIIALRSNHQLAAAGERQARSLKRELRRVERAIELNPTSADLFSRRAQLLASLGKHELAVDSYLQALELQPSTADMPPAYGQWNSYDALPADAGTIQHSPPQDHNYRHTLAEAYSIRAYQHYEESRLVEAFNDYVHAFQLSSSCADLYQALMLEHKLESANGAKGATRPNWTLVGARD